MYTTVSHRAGRLTLVARAFPRIVLDECHDLEGEQGSAEQPVEADSRRMRRQPGADTLTQKGSEARTRIQRWSDVLSHPAL